MLGNLALESRRNRCLVIGEDLCTVAHEVRVALQGGGALSYRLLYFEKDAEGDFLPPAEFPAQAAVAISTHDLPPLNAFWRGTDLERRAEFGLFPNDTVRKQQIVGRAQDRAQLLLALEREGLLPAGLRADPATVNEMSDELMIAVHAYLARSASQLMIVQPEDVFGQCEQINLPGTIDECPNWRRKLVLNLDAWRSDMRIQALALQRQQQLRAILRAADDLLLAHRVVGEQTEFRAALEIGAPPEGIERRQAMRGDRDGGLCRKLGGGQKIAFGILLEIEQTIG